MSKLSRGYLIAIVGTAIWSSTAVFIRFLNVKYAMPPLVLAFWRDLFAALALALCFVLFAPRLLRFDRRQIGFLWAYGLLLALFNSFWTLSVAYNGAAVSTVLAYSSPAFTALFGWRLFGEKIDRFKVFFIFLSIVGCVFVAGAYNPQIWQLNPLGILTGVISGIAFAAYSLMGKASANRGLNSWTMLCATFFLAALFLLPINYLAYALRLTPQAPNLLMLGNSLPAWGILLLLALIPTIGGYGLYNLSLTYLPATVSNLIATMEPAFTGLQAYLLLGERFSLAQLGGSLLILTSVILLRLRDNAAPADKSAAEAVVPAP